MGQSVLRVAGAVVGAALLGGAVAAQVGGAGRDGAAAVTALLVVENPAPQGWSVAVVSLAGKRVPVPVRVREAPLGLSPDASLLAEAAGDAVLLGSVRGGAMKPVITGECPPRACPYGVDPTFAWSPTSRLLAVAANRQDGPTSLRVVDRSGRVVRSFTPPGLAPGESRRAYYHLVSWSPDGSRLLFIKKDYYFDRAVAVLEVATGRWRTLARIEDPHDSPTVTWSPNGRFVSLTSEGRSGNDYVFAVIEAAGAKVVISCKAAGTPTSACPGGTAWASDSRSVFGLAGLTISETNRASSRIDRFYLSGRRSTVLRAKDRRLTPRVGLPTGLVYEESSEKRDYSVERDALYRYDFASGHRTMLISSRSGIQAVVPLSRLP